MNFIQQNNSDYIIQLYAIYLKNPQAVNADWRQYFESLDYHPVETKISSSQQSECNEIYRKLGHLHAKLDPLGLMPLLSVPELDACHDKKLAEIYCQSIGAEYAHLSNQKEVQWIAEHLENPAYRQPLSTEQQKHILMCLSAAEGFEKYLGAKYVGQKRFSLEGGDSLIVLLDELIQYAGKNQIKEIVMGMAHRGRLNVLVNNLGKSPQDLFNEFEGKNDHDNYSGDVKYHLGFSSNIQTPGGIVYLALAFNPSHLEIVSPVSAGSVYARQQRRPLQQHSEVLGVQIHGDAAFAGQGVVMETFSLSQTTGYGTQGTIHIIVNNQIGFTTNPIDARSTYYCTDIAKMVQAPVFHVNADDPEAVVFLTKLAIDYRQTFKKDIVIDLVCYRRHGHNEADEPSATQPLMYHQIRLQPTARKIYADKLINTGVITSQYAETLLENYRQSMDKSENPLTSLVKSPEVHPFTVDWAPYLGKTLKTHQTVDAKVSLETIKKLGLQINTLPEGMILQPQVAKIIADNIRMAKGEIPMNWGFAENLAYATLLQEGFGIRISGQDSARGTFAHRHAVLHHHQNGTTYTPLAHISPKFAVIDSILSEAAVLAFEYGYATASPHTLVVWEAQFGDFANSAQVVIDQFISSGEQKWKKHCGLVLLLPHGLEGMGPEHSSARLERYLQLCAQENMQVCIPTTPAQMFHLLRRQILPPVRKPLIVMTPKSLLRHKLAVSQLNDLSQGKFQQVIPESEKLKAADITRVILCTGKIYYELLDARQTQKIKNISIIRIEQLYPFPSEEIAESLKTYKTSTDIIWCQEEPENQGAWCFVKSYIEDCLNQKGQQLRYIGRSAGAAPATGSSKLHLKEQQEIIEKALSRGK